MKRFLSCAFLLACLHAEDATEWTPAHSMKFREVSSAQPSPDGKLAIWTQREAVIAEEKSEYVTHVFLGKSDGSWRVQLTRGEKSATNPDFPLMAGTSCLHQNAPARTTFTA